MKKEMWFVVVLAFVAGYWVRGLFMHTSLQKTSSGSIAQESIQGKPKCLSEPEASVKTNVASSTVVHSTSVSFAAVSSHAGAVDVVTSSSTMVSVSSVASSAASYAKEISDEDIDKVIPSPFNESLKHHHGEIREKFKVYANTDVPSDWDIKMQNKISDFVYSNPYAKFLSVEFMGCKAGLCELRIFENKKGVWNLIMAEMAQQDWWDIGGYSAAGDYVKRNDVEVTAWHVLLPKK